jgi:hypothetical protein
MAKKKPEPESHLIDGIGEQSPSVEPSSEVGAEAFIVLQGTVINFGNNLISAQMEIDHLKRRVDALAKVIEQNYGKVI